MTPKKRALLICAHNSARSQLAEEILRSLAGDRDDVFSAGTGPSRIQAYMLSILKEQGIDTSGLVSKGAERFQGESFDYVVTVCDQAQDSCPFFPGGKVDLHRDFDDPSAVLGSEDGKLAAFRAARDQIREGIEEIFS